MNPIFLLLCLILLSSFSYAKQPANLGTLLTKYYSFLQEDEPTIILIYFIDKGNSMKLLKGNPTQIISERSLQRRLKVKTINNVIDEQDLPLEQSYTQEISKKVQKIRHELKWFNAVSAVATKRQIEIIRQLPFVKEVELVGRWKKKSDEESDSPIKENMQIAKPSAANPLDYGTSFTQVNQINVPKVHDKGIYGQGVVVCMFDNGFRILNHESFATMNIVAQYDFVDHKESVIPNNTNPSFGSHGVNTLSTIGGYKSGQLIGPAFKADYILARTENDSSETPIEEDNWAKGIEWADSIGVDVTSTSLGYLDYDPPYPSWTWADMNGNTTLITKAADRAVNLGIVVLNSAGNSGYNASQNTLIAPADGDSVIAVGAVYSNGIRTSFSSVGPTTDAPPRIKPDVMAMGSGVKVASSTNTTGYGLAAGTSFSCPLSAGVAALILCANPTLNPMQIRDAMRQTASQAATPDNLMGWGILNTDSAIKYFGALPMGRISGMKFNDLNYNGSHDPGEPPIEGAKVLLSGTLHDSTFTNAQGVYLFDSLPIGNHIISAAIQWGWKQTHPTASYSINLLHRGDSSGLDFGAIYFPDSGYNHTEGWNLLSLPYRVATHVKNAIYPDASSEIFFYQGSYVPIDTIPDKIGYWLKLNSPGNTLIDGTLRLLDTIDVNPGWNMIGAPSQPLSINSIIQIPDSIITPNVFEFNNGYSTVQVLIPYKGYWVKAKSEGKLVFNTSTSTHMISTAEKTIGTLQPLSKISVEDQLGNKGELYFSSDERVLDNVESFELPPIPPSGAFDIRYANNHSLEIAENGNIKDCGILVSSAKYPLTFKWDKNDLFTSASFIVNGEEIMMNEQGEIKIEREQVDIKLRLYKMPIDALPMEFALYQNYPNPFNPSTRIHFEVPKEIHVTLKVYDMLGQEMATLVNEVKKVGRYEVEFDGNNLASGIYYYRLISGSFIDVKKMIVLQ
ncbi:MAG: S8 family serine peptidase [Bacteroidota bacterium]|nr:S8 family serine peptidase [Bacteroidota bacterium]